MLASNLRLEYFPWHPLLRQIREIDHNVGRLKIPMNYIHGEKIQESLHDLLNAVMSLSFRQASSSLHKLCQTTTVAVLHDQVEAG